MARMKPGDMCWIRDLQHANQAMGEMAEISRGLARIEGEMNSGIDALKARADAEAEPLRKRLKMMEDGLSVYAQHNKDELFAERKTLDLVFGVMGFRKSTELNVQPKTTWAMVLGKLKDLAFKDAIRIREEPNKDVMREWPDERLALVGARRVERDVFWYELKEEEVA